jgi:hypothetical protein
VSRDVEFLKHREVVLDFTKNRIQFTAIVHCPNCEAEEACEDAEIGEEYLYDFECKCGHDVEGSFTVAITGYTSTASPKGKK